MNWERKDTMLAALALPLMVIIATAGTCKMKRQAAAMPKPGAVEGPFIEETVEELVSNRRVKLNFEEHTASWLAHDNAFAHGKNENSRHRSGVVFQLGDYRDFRINSTLAGFTGVRFEGSAGEQTFERGEFFWINIVSADPDKTEDPIAIDDVGQLYLDPDIEAECIPVEKCSGRNCLGKAQAKIPEQCVRQRQIDTRYKPHGLMTYWQGADGYEMETWHDGGHTWFTFTFLDPVTVTVYKNNQGDTLPLNVGTIAKIFINLGHPGQHTNGGGIITHGEVHDPGFGGGLTKGKGGG